MTLRRIILLRHGQTDYNVAGRMQGHLDSKLTAVGVTVFLLVLGVDFALMWGILTFFLSFVPYVGLVLAAAPPVLLAEFGVGRAVLVIVGVTVVNILAENVLSPMMMSRGLSISPTVFCRSCSGPGCSVGPAPFWLCP